MKYEFIKSASLSPIKMVGGRPTCSLPSCEGCDWKGIGHCRAVSTGDRYALLNEIVMEQESTVILEQPPKTRA